MNGSLFRIMIITVLALSAILPGRAVPVSDAAAGEARTGSPLIGGSIFEGGLEEAFALASAVLLVRPAPGPAPQALRDQRPERDFLVLRTFKGQEQGQMPKRLRIRLPGQLIAFHPHSGRDYLVFLLGAPDQYSLMTHSLSHALAFAVTEGGLISGDVLPPGWGAFSLEEVGNLPGKGKEKETGNK